MSRTLQDFINDLPEQTCLFVARVGEGQSLRVCFRGVLIWAIEEGYTPSHKDTVPTKQYADIQSCIDALLNHCEDEGFGYEYSTVRIQAMLIDRTPVGTKVIRKEVTENISFDISPIQALTNANIRMCEEMRRGYKEVVNNNRAHLQTIEQLTSAYVEARKEMLELERTNMAQNLVLNMENDNGVDYKAQGLEVLNRAVDGFFQTKVSNLDEMIKDTIKNDPEKVKEFCEDPDVVESIKSAIFGD